MAVIVVGGNAKDVGKTAMVCGVIAALREFAWTAVKITGHDYEPMNRAEIAAGVPKGAIREEMKAGTETDTGRYLVAGAHRALLVTRNGSELPIDEIRRALGGDRNVIFESNRIVDVLRPDICLALVGDSTAEVKESFRRLLHVADALVSLKHDSDIADAPAEIPRFRLQSPDMLSPDMEEWLRERLKNVPEDRTG